VVREVGRLPGECLNIPALDSLKNPFRKHTSVQQGWEHIKMNNKWTQKCVFGEAKFLRRVSRAQTVGARAAAAV
jgi:hypothetical protein